MDLGVASATVAAIVALVPASVALWRGRRLARLADDPALPERLVAGRASANIILVACMAFLATACTGCLIWSVPLLLVTRLAAAYPLRRTLYRETWSLTAYLWFFIRLWIGFFGFWVLLCATPALVAKSAGHAWLAGFLLAVVLICWQAFSADVVLRLLNATPIADAALAARFARMAEASEARPVPRTMQVNLNGGSFANAVALPSITRPAVALSETLLNRLDADESVAICGHELAHLEHFNVQRLKRSRLAMYALVAATGAVTPVLRQFSPSISGPLTAFWPVVVLMALGMRARRRQQHETASDLRAIALAQNPEALIRALVKLHAMARVPRRWDQRLERAATHPSLARRIRAIRAAAGSPAASLGTATTVTAADGVASVVFEADRLIWHEGPAASHTLSYSHLSELRVDARSPQLALVAADEQGHKWTLPLPAHEVARVQSVLDVVDARVSTSVAAPRPPLRAARLMTAVIGFVAIVSGQFAVMIAALLAFARPVPALVAAVGAAALTAAGIMSRDAVVPFELVFAFAFIAVGVPLIGLSIRRRSDDDGSPMWREVGALAASAGVAWLVVAASGLDLVHLHQSVRAWPATATMSLALCAALAMWRAPVVRCAAPFAALVGIIAICAGSTSFLDAFSGDPLLTPTRMLASNGISPRMTAEFRVGPRASALRLSPMGRALALISEEDDEESSYRIGRPGSALTTIDAQSVVFPDEDRAIELVRAAGGLEVREIAVDDPRETLWRHPLPHLTGGRLSLVGAGAWAVLSRTADNQIVRVSGSIDGGAQHERRWAPPSGRERLWPIAATPDGLVLMSARYSAGALSPLLAWRLGLGGSRTASRFIVLTNDGATIDAGTTDLVVNCLSATREDGAPVCSAFDGTRTHFIAVEPSMRRISPLGAMRGRFFPAESSERGWISGFWNGRACALDLATLDAVHLNDPLAGVVELVATDHAFGALITSIDGASVRLYERQ